MRTLLSATAPWASLSQARRGTLARLASRLTRFALVGATGVLVNTALLYLLVEMAGLNHLAAAALATEAAILSNFTLNDRWTFRQARSRCSWLGRAARYNTIALGGLVISVTMLAALTYLLHWPYLVANLGGIGAATLWNYSANAFFTWEP